MTLFGNNLCKCDQVVFILDESVHVRGNFDTDTQGRWHVKRQTETGVMCLQAKGQDSSNHPEAVFVSEDMKRSDPSYIAAWRNVQND